MKLQDALRQIVSERGIDALSERSLIELLDGLGGFAEYPALWQVMGTIAERGCGTRLCRIRRDEGLAGAISYARSLSGSLQDDFGFREEFACYASDCIVFALGLAVPVREPSDHGTEPVAQSWSGAEPDGPEGEETEDDAGTRYGLMSLDGWFSLRGRMPRREWWCRWLLILMLSIACWGLYGVVQVIPEHYRAWLLIAPIGLAAASFFFLSARRLHDLGLSGWWTMAVIAFCVIGDLLAPGVSWLIMLLFCVRLGFFRGTKGPNFYGPDPVK